MASLARSYSAAGVFEKDVSNSVQNNPNGMIKIITGVISPPEQGADDVSPDLGKPSIRVSNNTAVMLRPHQCLTSIATFFL